MERLNEIAAELHEFNPMLGHRGCRLAVTYPEIAEMQTTAIMEAAIETAQEKDVDIVAGDYDSVNRHRKGNGICETGCR